MGIRDFIQNTKNSFSAAQRADKLQLQKVELARRRKQAEAKNLERAQVLRLQTDVAEEKRRLRLAKGARFAEAKAGLKKGLGGLKKVGDRVKANKAKREKNMARLGTVGGTPNFMQGSSSRSGIFGSSESRGGVLGARPEPKEKKRTVTIRL